MYYTYYDNDDDTNDDDKDDDDNDDKTSTMMIMKMTVKANIMRIMATINAYINTESGDESFNDFDEKGNA